jgi:hypothetical protein
MEASIKLRQLFAIIVIALIVYQLLNEIFYSISTTQMRLSYLEAEAARRWEKEREADIKAMREAAFKFHETSEAV